MAGVQSPAPGTPRERYLDDQRQLMVPLHPRWHGVAESATAFTIHPDVTWRGSDRLILPFHQWQPSFTSPLSRPLLEECPVGSISLTTTGLGGIVDASGTPATAATYLIWGFLRGLDGGFLGYGITRKPDYVGTSGAAAPLGNPVTVTFPGNVGYAYSVGCRVIVRTSTALSTVYNQGTVTAVTATTITATLDAAYTGAGPQTINAAIPAATVVEVVQLDHLAPWVIGTTQETYGTNVPFALLGTVEVNSGGGIAYFRHPGEHQWPATPITVLSLLGVGVGNTNISLRRWVGRHVHTACLESDVQITGGPGGPTTVVTVDAGASYGRFIPCATNAATLRGRGHGELNPDPATTGIVARVTVNGASTLNAFVYLRGWTEEAC